MKQIVLNESEISLLNKICKKLITKEKLKLKTYMDTEELVVNNSNNEMYYDNFKQQTINNIQTLVSVLKKMDDES